MAEVSKPQVIVKYEGTDISEDLTIYLKNTSYKDNYHGKADEIELTFNDTDKIFQNDWYPDKKAKVQILARHAGIEVNWGTFFIGNVDFSFPPDEVVWHCTSIDPNGDLRTKKSKNFSQQSLLSMAKSIAKVHGLTVDDGSKTLTTSLPPTTDEQAKLVKLAELFLSYSNEPNTVFFYDSISALLIELNKVISSLETKGYPDPAGTLRKGVADLLVDKSSGESTGSALQVRRLGASKMSTIITGVKADLRTSPTEVRRTLNTGLGKIMVETEIQHQETDLEFLLRIANKYGFAFNIKPPYLVFYPVHQLTNAASVAVIDKESVTSGNLSDKVHETYSDVNVSSHNPIENETVNNGTQVPNTAAEQSNLTFLAAQMRGASAQTDDDLRAILVRKIVDNVIRTLNGLREKGFGGEFDALRAEYAIITNTPTKATCGKFADFCGILKNKLIKIQASGNRVSVDKDAYEGGQSDNVLQVRTKAENKEQADAIGKAALFNANSETRTGSLTVPGNLLLVAGSSFELTGVGRLSQKYIILSSTHDIADGGAYTTTIEFKSGPVNVTAIKKGKNAGKVKIS
jgi:phage protein D